MFSIHKKKENGFEKVILKDNHSNTYATILPACGAILHDFVVNNNGAAFNIIQSYTSGDDFKKHVESKGFLGCKLSPFVCRLNEATYRFEGKKYAIEKFRIGKNALHGVLYDRKFLVTDETAGKSRALVTMKYEYRAEDPGYPFNYDCVVTWHLEEGNRLTVTTECINRDDGVIPMQDGWHPYFDLGDAADELQLEFQSLEMVEFDEKLIPTQKLIKYSGFTSLKKIGNILLDNCFSLNMEARGPLCVLRNPEKKIELEIHPGKSYSYLQVYIPRHRKSIAIENISSPPDAFNNGIGLTILDPRKSVLFTTTYKINHLK
ncbi:MAG: aldose 1-epimerase [Ginsengibacter sp.]